MSEDNDMADTSELEAKIAALAGEIQLLPPLEHKLT
jgi:hypothetical protein